MATLVFKNLPTIRQKNSKQALIYLAHMYYKLSYSLPKSQHKLSGKQLTPLEKLNSTDIQRWIRKSKTMIRKRPKQITSSEKKYSHVFPGFPG